MLNPQAQRLSDVDVAVELAPKEADYDLVRALNRRRKNWPGKVGSSGTFLEMELWWHRETFQFLKGGSRVIALADYAAEKSFILAVPHRVLIGRPEQLPAENPAPPTPTRRSRRPRGLPF
jgi:hypothetical protein